MDAPAIIGLVLNFVTAVSASYLAFAALVHSARPRASVVLLDPVEIYTRQRVVFAFAFRNRGYWYATPMIVNMTVYLNFDPAFDLVEMRSGSTQQNTSTHVKIGKGDMKYFKSKGMHLSRGDREEIHVVAHAPVSPGRYRLKVSSFSENGASLSEVFSVEVLRPPLDADSRESGRPEPLAE